MDAAVARTHAITKGRIQSSLSERGTTLPYVPSNSSLNEHRHHFVREQHAPAGQPQPAALFHQQSRIHVRSKPVAKSLPDVGEIVLRQHVDVDAVRQSQAREEGVTKPFISRKRATFRDDRRRCSKSLDIV